MISNRSRLRSRSTARARSTVVVTLASSLKQGKKTLSSRTRIGIRCSSQPVHDGGSVTQDDAGTGDRVRPLTHHAKVVDVRAHEVLRGHDVVELAVGDG